MRDILKPLLPLSMVLLPSAAFSEPPSIENFQEYCADKTDLYMAYDASGELIKKGEKIDGYCAGFLEGVLAALEHEKLACPNWEKDRISADFLLSVLNHYAEEKSSNDVNASIVVAKAFKRAFPCDSE